MNTSWTPKSGQQPRWTVRTLFELNQKWYDDWMIFKRVERSGLAYVKIIFQDLPFGSRNKSTHNGGEWPIHNIAGKGRCFHVYHCGGLGALELTRPRQRLTTSRLISKTACVTRMDPWSYSKQIRSSVSSWSDTQMYWLAHQQSGYDGTTRHFIISLTNYT